MKLFDVLREAWKDAIRQVIPTLLLFLVSLGATCGSLLAAGQQMAQQETLQDQLQAPQARVITVRENSGALSRSLLEMI